jgi:hypothetical protein
MTRIMTEKKKGKKKKEKKKKKCGDQVLVTVHTGYDQIRRVPVSVG